MILEACLPLGTGFRVMKDSRLGGCEIFLHGEGVVRGVAGKSLQRGPYWFLCKSVKMKPQLHWRFKDVGDFTVIICLTKRVAYKE